jgi:hypothetical protein
MSAETSNLLSRNCGLDQSIVLVIVRNPHVLVVVGIAVHKLGQVAQTEGQHAAIHLDHAGVVLAVAGRI